MRKVLLEDPYRRPPLNANPEEVKALFRPSIKYVYAIPYTLYRNYVINFRSPVRAMLK